MQLIIHTACNYCSPSYSSDEPCGFLTVTYFTNPEESKKVQNFFRRDFYSPACVVIGIKGEAEEYRKTSALIIATRIALLVPFWGLGSVTCPIYHRGEKPEEMPWIQWWSKDIIPAYLIGVGYPETRAYQNPYLRPVYRPAVSCETGNPDWKPNS